MQAWRVRDVMTDDVATVRADTPYREVVDTLAAHKVSAVPVVDADGRVVGLVSEADLLHKIEFVGEERRVFAGRRRREAQAKAHGVMCQDLMSTPAVTIEPEASLTTAARRMEHERVKRLPVVDAGGRLVGIVSRADLLRVYLQPDEQIERYVSQEVLRRTLWVEPGLVKVDVTDGVVTLAGRTDRHSTKQLALSLTRAVPGVVDVADQLGYDFDDRQLAEPRYPFGMP